MPTTRRSTIAPPHAPSCKKYPHLTIHGHERASLQPRGLSEVFYKMATARACSGEGVMGEAWPRFTTVRAVRCPVNPATLWMHVVSAASARVICGKMVVGRVGKLEVLPCGE